MSHQISQLTLTKADDEGPASEPPQDDPQSVLSQIAEWLQEQKAKTSDSRHHRFHRHHVGTEESRPDPQPADSTDSLPAAKGSELDLGKLESILSNYAAASGKNLFSKLGHRPSLLSKDHAARKKRRFSLAPTSSDTEQQDNDLLVPNVEATLDNSKAMSYTAGAASGTESKPSSRRKDKAHWAQFKQDIVRLTHTLRLKGWRRIPIEHGGEIEVKRLSGALTNAVYVVAPPKEIPQNEKSDSLDPRSQRRRPTELLLRVYGAQAEHLIDRENELSVLRRLARKRIGPRMLGTFTNGRFEQFLHATTLTAQDLRDSATSKQIAKRMRELHDGIELLQAEYEEGPRVFVNWNQWVSRCEEVITWLDNQVKKPQAEGDGVVANKYTSRGFICGVEWSLFRKMVEKYHQHLVKVYGGKDELKKHLVFAHNDTQYGNLLRLQPEENSPMLLAANQHKQLVVIDFEYASQNTKGLEFANHFTEWCYNYHHPEMSSVCNTRAYPTPEEQYRFVRSYVMHRPQFNPAASATPRLDGREKTNIPDFMLDARTPQGMPPDYDAEEKARLEKQEEDIHQLLNETLLWRPANTAMWVAWGIVQAKIPEMETKPKSRAGVLLNIIQEKLHPQSDPLTEEEKALREEAKHDRPEGREQEEAHEEGNRADEEEEEFDYLSYAQERAMFFWGDCLQMGFIKPEELPDSMKYKIKIVKY